MERNESSEECNVFTCPYIISKDMYIFTMFLFALVILIGVIMNSAVGYIYFKGLVKQSACNMTLLCLSVSDLGSDLFAVPYLFLDHTYLDISELEGRVVCGVSQAGFIICLGVSIVTLAFISTTRFCLINYPFHFAWIHSKKSVRIFIAGTWTVVVGGLMPLFISLRHEKLTNICYREWPSHMDGEIYSSVMFVLGFLIPIFIMFVTFGVSTRTLLKTPTIVREQSLVYKERRRIMVLLGSLIFVFVTFWGPYFTFWVLSRVTKVFPTTVTGEYSRKKWVRIGILISLGNTIADPIVYVATGKEFRQAFHKVILNRRRRALTQSTSVPLCEILQRKLTNDELTLSVLHNAGRSSRLRAPSMRTPSMGTPSIGTPSIGTPSMGTPPTGTTSMETPPV